MAQTYIKKNAVPKKEYKFKVYARNVYGTGVKSVEAIISTGQRPSAPATITSVNPTLNGTIDYSVIDIAWKVPNDNGSPITHYIVKILKKNNSDGGQYVEDKNMCDGSKKRADGLLPLRCRLKSVDLKNNFNYKIADRLLAVVVACNKVGCSSDSKPNTRTKGQVDELKPFTLIGGRKSRN